MGEKGDINMYVNYDVEKLFNTMFNFDDYQSPFDTIGYKFENNKLQFPVPGYSKDDIDVEIVNDVFYIKGNKEEFGKFNFKAKIPKGTEKIDIDVTNGMFTATFTTKNQSDIQINWAGDDEKKLLQEEIEK